MCNAAVRLKSYATLFKNYGVYGALANPDSFLKFKKTMMLRYGYESTAHDPQHLEKMLIASRKYKKYYLPSGKMVYLQGYED